MRQAARDRGPLLRADEYKALNEAIAQIETLLRTVKDTSRRAELAAVRRGHDIDSPIDVAGHAVPLILLSCADAGQASTMGGMLYFGKECREEADMLESHLQMALRHVREMEGVVARQREIIAALEDAHQDAKLAQQTLATMERTLRLARDDLARHSKKIR